MNGHANWLLTAAATGVLAGCLGFPRNPELVRVDPDHGYRFDTLELGPGNTDETFVILTLSGGGTRAAAFSYGVLQRMRETRVGTGDRTLVDEVDVISSVSGGSFAAAYLGLFGAPRFFAKFESEVLDLKIERDLLWRLFAPWNWVRLSAWSFGRGDLADEYYSNTIFEERTFADMRKSRPFIMLNATDVSLGARFAFTQEQFDALCSDLNGLPVSRAVAASSAFPVVFQPLTLQNYAKCSCGYSTPKWVANALKDRETNPRRYDSAQALESYKEDKRRPFVHVMDGGLSDNLGLRGPYQGIATTDGEGSVLRLINMREVRRLVVIAVDARPGADFSADASATGPRLSTVLNATGTVAMERYSLDTVELLREHFGEWDSDTLQWQQARERCNSFAPQRLAQCYATFGVRDEDAPPNPERHWIHVSFDDIRDPRLRDRVKAIPTRLELPEDDIRTLIQVAHGILDDSEDYQQLERELAGTLASPMGTPGPHRARSTSDRPGL